MRPGFSEFSYGYALTEALVDGQQHLVRPTFPTLRAEGKSGYDLHLDRPGYPLFLQFKLCDGIQSRGAMELKKFRLPLHLPFLRMNLMPARRSQQHSLLLKLESRGETVFYAAPRFFNDNEFASHYRNREMVSHSAFVSPGAIGPLPDEGKHHVAFECGSRKGWLLSDPRELEPILDGDGFEELNQMHLDNDTPMSERIRKALATICEIIVDDLQDNVDLFTESSSIKNLHADLSQWYSDFPDADGLMDSLDPIREDGSIRPTTELSSLLTDFLRILQETSENNDRIPENVNLLTKLAHLYFDATLILMTVKVKEQ